MGSMDTSMDRMNRSRDAMDTGMDRMARGGGMGRGAMSRNGQGLDAGMDRMSSRMDQDNDGMAFGTLTFSC